MKNDRKNLLIAVPFVLATVGLGLIARTLLGEHAPVILLAGFLVALSIGIAVTATVHLSGPVRRTRARETTAQDAGDTAPAPHTGAHR